METDAAAEALAKSDRAAMTAPAGCGKTQVIATAVARFGTGRELILTHTHAGVDALRHRLTRLGAVPGSYHLDTIAGWALRLARAFPKSSGLPAEQPRTDDEYRAVYQAAADLVRRGSIREILEASYTGVLVDEYQDCTIQQHDLVTALAEILPCRIVGDPLQGIFGFGNNEPVEWERDVRGFFEPLDGPNTPWRWKRKNPELGEWLQEVRLALERGDSIELGSAPVHWVQQKGSQYRERINACLRNLAGDSEESIAIRQWPWQCHDLAKRLGGRFSCVEPIDAKDLYEAARQIQSTRGNDRALAVLDFAKTCMTQVGNRLRNTENALRRGDVSRIRTNLDQLGALRTVADQESMLPVIEALEVLQQVEGAVVYRRELLREMKRAIRAFAAGEAETLVEAAWTVRNRTRRRGRLLPRNAVGTTLLVKGLEFDHAIILDAAQYDARNLYVAMTRGSRSLTIVSPTPLLNSHHT